MSEPEDHVVLWRGQKAADMTRDELLEAFQGLARMYQRSQANYLRELSALSAFREARRL